ncbi:ABC transporter permease [Tsukamurella soli]
MHWALYKRRATGGRRAANVIAAIMGLVAAVGLCSVAVGDDRALGAGPGHAIVGGWLALAVSGLGVAWLIFPVLSGFSDDTLHPRHFQLLPVRPGPLARGLFAASLLGLTVPVTAAMCFAVVPYAAVHAPAALPIAIVAWPLTVLLVVSVSRIAALGLSQLLQSRRSRELAFLLFGGLAALVYVGQSLVSQSLGTVLTNHVTWPLTVSHAIPFGWGVTAVDAAASGDWAVAVLTLAGSAALSAVCLVTWHRLVARQLGGRVSPSAGASAGQRRRSGRDTGKGWRTSALGAVVTRELTLWRGDTRRRSQLLMVAVFALVSGVGPLLVSSIPFSAKYGAWMVLYLAVSAASNSFGYDGRSFWHLAMIPTAAGADVRGRQLAWVLVTAPFAIAAAVVVRVFGADPLHHVAVPIAVTVAALGTGAGYTMVTSVKAAYPVPEAVKSISLGSRNRASGGAVGLALLFVPVLAVAVLPGALLALLPGALAVVGIAVAAVLGAGAWWWGGRYAIRIARARPDLIYSQVTHG